MAKLKRVGLMLLVSIFLAQAFIFMPSQNEAHAFSVDPFLGGGAADSVGDCYAEYDYFNIDMAVAGRPAGSQSDFEALTGLSYNDDSGSPAAIIINCPDFLGPVSEFGVAFRNGNSNTFTGAFGPKNVSFWDNAGGLWAKMEITVPNLSNPSVVNIRFTDNPNYRDQSIDFEPYTAGGETVVVGDQAAFEELFGSVTTNPPDTTPGTGTGAFLDVATIRYNGETYTDPSWGSEGGNKHKYFLSVTNDASRKETTIGNTDAMQGGSNPSTICVPYIEVEWAIHLDGNYGAGDITGDINNLGSGDFVYNNRVNWTGGKNCGRPASTNIAGINIDKRNVFFEYSIADDSVRTFFIDGNDEERKFIGEYSHETANTQTPHEYFLSNPTTNSPKVVFASDPSNSREGELISVSFVMRDGSEGLGTTNSLRAEVVSQSNLDDDAFDQISDEGGPQEATCESNVPALGWILCSVAEFLFRGVDGAMGSGDSSLLKNVLEFDLVTSQEGALRNVWSGFRAIANLGFVLAFFVVVYSAASGNALSSYDVKRMLPRLLIGAVAVQLSYFICTTLIAIFNDFGTGITGIILAPIPGGGEISTLFDNAFGNDGNGLSQWFEGLATALTLLLLIIAFLFALTGILLMMVVFLLRNMGIMILTILSPIAFVLWILPNTEGLFKKWWGFYIQLLALFPIAMAFLASGRLVAYVWGSGGGFAGRWIGIIAVFAPYILAPKLFQFAGGAITGLVRGVDGAKSSMKERSGKLRSTEMGKRAETGLKSKAASGINARYGEGGSGNRIAKKVAQSKMGQRALATPQYAQRKIEDEDMAAASILQKDSVARVRAEATKNNQDADMAEISHLTSVLGNDKASDAAKRSAAKTLVDVHSNKKEAVQALSDFVSSGSGGNKAEQELSEKVVQENIGGMLKDMPHVVKGISGTVGSNTSTVVTMKGGANKSMLQDIGGLSATDRDGHLGTLGRKYTEAAQNDALRGQISEGNAADLITAMSSAGVDTTEVLKHFNADGTLK